MTMLAFVHIEKAAGTSLIHILRRNYFLRHCDVRPLYAESEGVFSRSDLECYKRISPKLECISGHAVKPFGDLAQDKNINFITLLRDPVKRYISHYQHWIERKHVDISFEEFLRLESVSNFQTKKIVGKSDAEWAKEKLNNFFLVGTVEHFDEFLIMLRRKLQPASFNPEYEQKNAAREKDISEEIRLRYLGDIERQNEQDIVLYRHAVEHIRERNINSYGSGFSADLKQFQTSQSISLSGRTKSYADYLYRKFYIEPATGRVRQRNGLQKCGSY